MAAARVRHALCVANSIVTVTNNNRFDEYIFVRNVFFTKMFTVFRPLVTPIQHYEFEILFYVAVFLFSQTSLHARADPQNECLVNDTQTPSVCSTTKLFIILFRLDCRRYNCVLVLAFCLRLCRCDDFVSRVNVFMLCSCVVFRPLFCGLSLRLSFTDWGWIGACNSVNGTIGAYQHHTKAKESAGLGLRVFPL